MDLNHLATLLENPQPEYWAQVTQAQLYELRENVQRSSKRKAKNRTQFQLSKTP